MRGPSWLAELKARGGPLVETASRFAMRYADHWPAGPPGLALLAGVVDHWCEAEREEDVEEQGPFVEGAGSLLAVLILNHLGSGHHAARADAHRLHLGEWGYFDPFAAIEEVLESPNPRRRLAQVVRCAEAEARDQGPVSRVVSAIVASLQEDRRTVRDHFDCALELDDGSEIDVRRVVETTADQPATAAVQAAHKLVAMLRGNTSGEPWNDARSRLLPRVVGRAFIERLDESVHGLLWLQPLSGSLHWTVQLSYPGRARYVTQAEVERWGRPGSEIRRTALENLAARTEHARFQRVDSEHGPLVEARSGDGLDATRVLLPGLLSVLEPELGSEPVVSIPHRDTLLAAPGGHSEAILHLKTRTAEAYAQAPHRISERLFTLQKPGVLAPLRPRSNASGSRGSAPSPVSCSLDS